MKHLYFFVGKGGVGKTTASCAFAVWSALKSQEKRTLLMSTDPAHSLADILQVSLSERPKKLNLKPSAQIDVWQVNSEKLFSDFLAGYKNDILDLIDKGSIFSREDIAPLLETTLPGMAEVSALLAIREAVVSGKYSRIVVDTAPIGHTLRLFSLPDQFMRFVDFLGLAGQRDQVLADRFGGNHRHATSDLVDRLRLVVTELRNAIGEQAEVILVTTAEKFSLNETVRSSAGWQNQSSGARITNIVLNRVQAGHHCNSCKKSQRASNRAKQFLGRHFPDVPIHVGHDPGRPILGIKTLAAFGEHLFGGKRPRYDLTPPPSHPLKLTRTSWPLLDKHLTLVLGKGGVGKTTAAASLGFHSRQELEAAVEICSVDPAPSLDDIFQDNIGAKSTAVFGDPRFRASEMDAVVLFRDWVGDLRASIDRTTSADVAGIHVDLSFERQLLSQLLEIIPPGVDEVLAIFRIFDLVGRGKARIVIDMAPTGHALDLLRMPERILIWSRLLLKTLAAHRTLAFARDAAAKIAEMSVRVRELTALLNDPVATDLNVVMLPELLPDRETERLIQQIETLGLPPRRIFVNRLLMDKTPCRRCLRARKWQQASLAKIQKRYPNVELLFVRNFPNEVSGKAALQAFTRELWRLA